MSSRAPPSRDRDRLDEDDYDRQQREHQQNESDQDDSNEDDQHDHDSDDGESSSTRRSRRKKKGVEEEKKAAEITVERTVIHEALIRRAIHKELKTYYDPAVVPLESELELETVDKLVLSYCNIYAIDNLQGFEKLTELKLDNNIIHQIEHLDHLTNLRWLDLR